MSEDLQHKLKAAIGNITHAQYEGNVVGFVGFYFTKEGSMKQIICFDNMNVLNVIGACEMLKLAVIRVVDIQFKKDES